MTTHGNTARNHTANTSNPDNQRDHNKQSYHNAGITHPESHSSNINIDSASDESKSESSGSRTKNTIFEKPNCPHAPRFVDNTSININFDPISVQKLIHNRLEPVTQCERPLLLLRCNIFDRRTAVCLLDKTWQWPVQASPHDVSKMILSFHQISGQLGHKNKEINQVLLTNKAYYAIPEFVGQRKKLMECKKNTTFESIRMLARGDEHFSVGIFHKLTRKPREIQRINNFLTELSEEFSCRNHEQLLSLRKQLGDVASEKQDIDTDRGDIILLFKQFESVVEALRTKYFLDE